MYCFFTCTCILPVVATVVTLIFVKCLSFSGRSIQPTLQQTGFKISTKLEVWPIQIISLTTRWRQRLASEIELLPPTKSAP